MFNDSWRLDELNDERLTAEAQQAPHPALHRKHGAWWQGG